MRKRARTKSRAKKKDVQKERKKKNKNKNKNKKDNDEDKEEELMERGFAAGTGDAGRGEVGGKEKWILWFGDDFGGTSEHARNLVGGKGLNLSMCAKAGLPVPPGFCISTEALAACNMPVSSSKDLPSALMAAILAAYHELVAEHGSDAGVAVRSSATAEDGDAASFAG